MFKSVGKSFFIILGLSVLTIGLLILWLINAQSRTEMARAAAGGAKLRGFAWTDTIGWVSFNCRDTASCPVSNYEVGADEESGRVDGWAWSDNVGWINFAPLWDDIVAAGLDTGFISQCSPGCNADNDHCAVCYNKTDRKFFGWARVEAESSRTTPNYDTGWLRFDGINVSTIPFSVSVKNYDPANDTPANGEATWGDLIGWAWNGAGTDQATNRGLGWFSFNCANEGNCPASDYRVTGRPENPTIVSVKRTDGNDSYGLTIDWNYQSQPVYGATWYEVWRKNGVCVGGERDNKHCDLGNDSQWCPGGFCSMPARHSLVTYEDNGTQILGKSPIEFAEQSADDGTPTPPKNPLQFYITYDYLVRACNIFGCARSAASASWRTSPFEAIQTIEVYPACITNEVNTSWVDLIWYRPTFNPLGDTPHHYEIDYCRLDADQKISDCAASDWADAGPNCNDPLVSGWQQKCRDKYTNDPPSLRWQMRNNYFVYRLRAVGSKGTCVGGDKNGTDCTRDADCTGGGVCEINKGSWAYSKIFRLCVPASRYEEVRPQN